MKNKIFKIENIAAGLMLLISVILIVLGVYMLTPAGEQSKLILRQERCLEDPLQCSLP